MSHLLLNSLSEVKLPVALKRQIRRNVQLAKCARGYFYVDGSRRRCSYAYAVAAERLEMLSLAKMLLT
jgi:hypothetical protein